MSNEQNSLSGNNNKNGTQFRQFIQSNHSYLQEKYSEIFHQPNSQEGSQIKLTTIPIEKLLLYIYQIFSLQKYYADQKISQVIKSSVQQNVQEYLMQLQPNSQSKSDELTFQKLMQLLDYIVQTNSIFSIQYETKNKTNSSNKNNKSDFQVDIVVGQQTNGLNVIDDDFDINAKHNRNKRGNSFSLDNEFQTPSNLDSVNSHSISLKLVKKNAKAMFDFYCRQQMELGGVITFDRLNQETSSMSLGKCLTFAKATNLYSSLIRRDDFVAKFKKVSEGKKFINFEKFEAMIGQFQVMDPNFNRRVGLLSQDIRKVLKYVKLPFNTKDIQPREKIAVRNFQSKLTEHSGQTSESLKIQLEQKKQQILNYRKIKQIKEYLKWKQSRPEVIRQNDLRTSHMSKKKDLTVELSFIGSIIHPEEDDQTYLKDHLIPKLEKQTEKTQKFSKVFETERYQSLDKLTLRKMSVVSDIRKRIKQIESNQNLSIEKQLKRSQIISPRTKFVQA